MEGQRIKFHNGVVATIISEVQKHDYGMTRRFRVDLMNRGNPGVKGRKPNGDRSPGKPKPVVVSESEFVII